MKKKWMLLSLCVLLTALLAGCKCNHDWVAADCTTAKTCVNCKESIGEPLGHDWQEGTCLEAKKCAVCGRTEGSASGHKWSEATCTEASTCSVCGKTEGTANGHQLINATCTTPAYCTVCMETQGAPLGHLWILAVNQSGINARICDRCGEYETATDKWTPLTDCERINRSNMDAHLNDLVVGDWDSRAGKLYDSIRFCVANQESYKNTHYCTYKLGKNYNTLSGLISFSDKSEKYATMRIQIYLDNELAYESSTISETTGDASFTLDVRNVEHVRVVCLTQDTAKAYCVVSASVY